MTLGPPFNRFPGSTGNTGGKIHHQRWQIAPSHFPGNPEKVIFDPAPESGSDLPCYGPLVEVFRLISVIRHLSSISVFFLPTFAFRILKISVL